MGKKFDKVIFDVTHCKREVEELRQLLASKYELSEKKDILPFFKTRSQLCAFIGTFAPDIGPAPEIAHEFSFLGDFTADLFVGNRDNKEYLAIELEEGRTNSIFKDVGRSHTEWSRQFEHGYSQLIDWFSTLDDYRKTDKFRQEFGNGHITFSGLLIIGRTAGVSPSDRIRLDWRSDKVRVDSHVISCITFDDLYQILERRLRFYFAASSTKKRKN